MDNIVTQVAKKAGGLAALARLHKVTPQAAWLWEQNGYFPIKQIKTVTKNFPEYTKEVLMDSLLESIND